MNDEELLSAVGARAREAEDDPQTRVLERLARGEQVDERELAGIDEDTLALFRPVSAAAEERIVNKIAKPRLAEVRPIRPWVRYAPLAAAAAAAALFFAWPRGHEALPAYTFELSGNVAQVRADGPKVAIAHAKLHKEATLEIVLRPADKVKEKVVVAAALVRSGKATAWTPTTAISDDGAVRIVGPVRTLFPDVDAPWEIVLAIGPAAALPTSPGALLSAASDGKPGIRIVRGTIEFVP